jgi:hypothetical protein
MIPIDYNIQGYSLPVSMLVTSDYSSNSFLKEPFYQIIEDEQTKAKNKKLSILKNNIGDDLFGKLSDQQRQFIIGVSGSISLGKDISTTSLYSNSDDE